jgi:hypothetical protein
VWGVLVCGVGAGAAGQRGGGPWRGAKAKDLSLHGTQQLLPVQGTLNLGVQDRAGKGRAGADRYHAWGAVADVGSRLLSALVLVCVLAGDVVWSAVAVSMWSLI